MCKLLGTGAVERERMAGPSPMSRMGELDRVEKEIMNCLQSAGLALQEIAKDKPSQKQVVLMC